VSPPQTRLDARLAAGGARLRDPGPSGRRMRARGFFCAPGRRRRPRLQGIRPKDISWALGGTSCASS